MKYTIFYLILFLLLFSLQFYRCTDTISPQDQPIYYNSFERPSDLDGWIGLNAASLVDDAPSTGGKRSVYISGGCVMPTASYTIAPSGEDQFVLIHCYGKNLNRGGNVVLHIGDDYNFESSISVGDTIWRFYQCDKPTFWPADSSLTICLNSGGFVASAMLIDELKIEKSK